MKIEVEASALDKIKAMCERLQQERDELYWAVSNMATCDDAVSQSKAMDDCILLALKMDAPAIRASK